MEQSEHHRTWVTVGLILGLFLSALEFTVVATAMPRVIDDLGGQHLYSLPFALYMLFATVSGPLWGYASDLHGRRRLYLASVGLMLLGSGLCGAAPSMGWLVVARAIQGLGGGGLQTVTFTIIGELYPLEKRSQVQGFISGVWGLSALVGPLVGGFIVDALSWRWVFYLTIPFGVAGTVMVLRWYTEHPHHRGGQLDWAGAALFTTASGLLVYGLQTHHPLQAALGMVLLAAFPALELRQPNPLVPLRTLYHPLLTRAMACNFIGGMAFFGITAYLPLFAMETRGSSATVGGALLAPSTIGWTVASVAAARLLPRLGPRPLTRWGATAMVAGFLLWTVALNAPLWVLGGAGLLAGLGMGSAMLALFVSAQEEAPRQVLGSVTASLLFARSIGGALGSAAMGALLGNALDVGGRALQDVFWRVPGLSALLSLGVLLIAARLPERRRTAPAPATVTPSDLG